MKNTLLDISTKIDPITIEIFSAIIEAGRVYSVPLVVVGASARDMVLQHGYGMRVKRATTDIDFAIQVPNWSAFSNIQDYLVSVGFSRDKQIQRLKSPSGISVDVVPFGGVENGSATISWPPSGDVVMMTLGFKEAYENAQVVRICENPNVEIPVATPVSMSLLKLIAWSDRTLDVRRKDAIDLRYLLEIYSDIPSVNDNLYEEKIDILKKYDWDIVLSGAYLIGEHAKSIASEETTLIINNILLTEKTFEQLLEEMYEYIDSKFEHAEKLLAAYKTGFQS